jgi:hypothetical protein
MSDGDHHYVIPVELVNTFEAWVDHCYESIPYEGPRFDQYRINNSGWTFTDPQGY